MRFGVSRIHRVRVHGKWQARRQIAVSVKNEGAVIEKTFEIKTTRETTKLSPLPLVL